MQTRFRLRHTADFARLREKGKVRRHPLMILSYTSNTLGHNRYGFITGKRIGNAVTRNRARRLMREALRFEHEHIKPGHDLVLIARPAIVGRQLADVKDALTNLLARTDLPVHQ